LSGEVVLDVQITGGREGRRNWLVSSTDTFASLATAAVRQWEFEPISAKIRLVLKFQP
jgi:hypothetical protein